MDCGHVELNGVGLLLATVHLHGFNHDQRRLQIGFEFRRIHRHQAFGGRETTICRRAREWRRVANRWNIRASAGRRSSVKSGRK